MISERRRGHGSIYGNRQKSCTKRIFLIFALESDANKCSLSCLSLLCGFIDWAEGIVGWFDWLFGDIPSVCIYT